MKGLWNYHTIQLALSPAGNTSCCVALPINSFCFRLETYFRILPYLSPVLSPAGNRSSCNFMLATNPGSGRKELWIVALSTSSLSSRKHILQCCASHQFFAFRLGTYYKVFCHCLLPSPARKRSSSTTLCPNSGSAREMIFGTLHYPLDLSPAGNRSSSLILPTNCVSTWETTLEYTGLPTSSLSDRE